MTDFNADTLQIKKIVINRFLFIDYLFLGVEIYPLYIQNFPKMVKNLTFQI